MTRHAPVRHATPRLLAVAVLLLGALAAAGCAAGPAPSGGTPSGGQGSTGAGSVHLTAYSDNDGPSQAVIVTGAVGDHGQAVSIHPDGSVDPDHTGLLSLRLSHGTFRLDIAQLDQAFVAAMAHDFRGDPATCSGNLAVTRNVPVVSGSGTGAYHGIGGAFTLTLTLDEIDKAEAGKPCDGTSAFLSQAIVISGPGHVTLRG